MLINRAEDVTGDLGDVTRLSKQILNKTASKRLISQQECMVLLGGLNLVHCTESVETVTINNSKALRMELDTSTNRSIVTLYAKRNEKDFDLSLYEFFLKTKNESKRKKPKTVIPNFVGLSGMPTFPVTEQYARHTIIVYRKWWRNYPTNCDWIRVFHEFIKTPEYPVMAKMSYERAMRRHYDNMTGKDTKAHQADHSKNDISDESHDLLDLVGLTSQEYKTDCSSQIALLEKGKEYDWHRKPKVSDVKEDTKGQTTSVTTTNNSPLNRNESMTDRSWIRSLKNGWRHWSSILAIFGMMMTQQVQKERKRRANGQTQKYRCPYAMMGGNSWFWICTRTKRRLLLKLWRK